MIIKVLCFTRKCSHRDFKLYNYYYKMIKLISKYNYFFILLLIQYFWQFDFWILSILNDWWIIRYDSSWFMINSSPIEKVNRILYIKIFMRRWSDIRQVRTVSSILNKLVLPGIVVLNMRWLTILWYYPNIKFTI